MKFLIVLCATFAAANAYFECDQCDAQSSREDRTACRFFCYVDTDNTGVLTRDNLFTRFNEWNGGNPVPASIFVPKIQEVVSFCEQEARDTFDLFAALGDGDVTNVERADIEAFLEILELLTGSNQTDKDTWGFIYGALYALVGDDGCSSGF